MEMLNVTLKSRLLLTLSACAVIASTSITTGCSRHDSSLADSSAPVQAPAQTSPPSGASPAFTAQQSAQSTQAQQQAKMMAQLAGHLGAAQTRKSQTQ